MVPSALSSLLVCSLLAVPLLAQTTTSTPQPITVLQNALKALVGSTAINDVTLTGTAERIAGSDDETGTVTYQAVAGSSRLDLNLSKGTRSEIRGVGPNGPAGNWIGPDGVAHEISNHNLLADTGWFPAFTLGNLISSSGTVLTYVGQETRDGAPVIHISASQPFPNLSGDLATLMQHLTQGEIYLDPATLLPVSYVFKSHPDNNALLDIPTEIRYSNYQTFGGAQIPLHVQKFLNNSLTLNLQFHTASLNTGVTAAQITAQ